MVETENIKQILTNLKEGRKEIEAHTTTHFHLDMIARDTNCGTIYCSAGVLGTKPYFQKLGLVFNPRSRDIETNSLQGFDELFGIDAWSILFSTYTSSAYDAVLLRERKLPLDHKQSTNEHHKILALARFDKQISIYEGKLNESRNNQQPT